MKKACSLLALVGPLVLAACLAGCVSLKKDSARDVSPAGQLLGEVREITDREGLPAAKSYLVTSLTKLDGSGGSLERRIILTTADSTLILPDSLAAMPYSKRQKTSLVIIPGTRAGNQHGRDHTRECLGGAAEQSRAMGFATHFLRTEARGTIEENADLIAVQMSKIFAESDNVIILMLSKGAHDVIHYLQEGGAGLSLALRRKLVAVISLAGTVQGSVVADWLVTSPRPVAGLTRTWLRISGQDDAIGMLRSIGESPWRQELAGKVAGLYPRLTWVSIAMVPDGPDGRIGERLWSPFLRKRVEKCAPFYSPSDGLVESAASVLPETVGLPEWIVVAFGSHAMPNGCYRDGSRIAPLTTKSGREKLAPETGGEVISAYLRALPQSLIQ
jgi:hypothetical protein